MLEYGVRYYGGHIVIAVSKHVAEREAEEWRALGHKNVWVVVREVSDWRRQHVG